MVAGLTTSNSTPPTISSTPSRPFRMIPTAKARSSRSPLLNQFMPRSPTISLGPPQIWAAPQVLTRCVSLVVAFEADHGNQAVRPFLVVRKRRPDLGHLLVKPFTLGAIVDNMGASLELLSSAVGRHLDLDLGVGLYVPEPRRVRGGAPLRGNDDAVGALAAADERGGDGLAALGPFRGHEQHVVAERADSTALFGVELVDRLLVVRRCLHKLEIYYIAGTASTG